MKRAYRALFHRARERDAARSIRAILSEKTSSLLCALLRHDHSSSALLRRTPLQAEHHGWSAALSSSAVERAHGRLLWLSFESAEAAMIAHFLGAYIYIWTMWWDSSLHLREPEQRHPMEKWCYSSLTRLGRPLENKFGPVLKDLRFTLIRFKCWVVRG